MITVKEAKKGVVQFPYIYYISEETSKESTVERPMIELKIKKTSWFTSLGLKLLYQYYIKKEKMPRITDYIIKEK